MARRPNDPDLNKLARELLDLSFETHDLIERSPGDEVLRVSLMPNQRTWAVKFYLGGAHRTVGYSDDLTTACRYADMAAWRFWKYRVRGACPPVDAELNFGVEHVKIDCANELHIMELLDRIELHLKTSGSLPEYKELEAERKIARSERDKRRTVRNDMVILFDDVFRALGEIIERLERMEGRGNPTAETFKRRVPFLVDKKDFIVTVPNPIRTHEVLGKRLIQIPVRIVDGQEIILPEGLELIEKTKRDVQDEYIRIMQNATAPKDVIDGILNQPPVDHEQAVKTPHGFNLLSEPPAEIDIFPDPEIKPNQTNP